MKTDDVITLVTRVERDTSIRSFFAGHIAVEVVTRDPATREHYTENLLLTQSAARRLVQGLQAALDAPEVKFPPEAALVWREYSRTLQRKRRLHEGRDPNEERPDGG